MLQGSCGHPPPAVLTGALSGAAIPEDLAGRKLCMVVTDGALLATQGGRLWLDGIFIRYQKTPRSACFDNGILQLNGEEKENASAWMTSMTVQGYDGRAQGQDCDRYLGGVAIAMQSAQLFAEGVRLHLNSNFELALTVMVLWFHSSVVVSCLLPDCASGCFPLHLPGRLFRESVLTVLTTCNIEIRSA